MQYWLDLFTPATWDEFREAGSSVVGFRDTMRKYVEKVAPGDVLLCYMTGGSKQWVGALRVVGASNDDTQIWRADAFPVRLSVEPIVALDRGKGVPLDGMMGQVDFYPSREERAKLSGFLRRCLNRISTEDGELILGRLKNAE